jgi:hypothetical protein
MQQFCSNTKQIEYVYRHSVSQMGEKESFSHVDAEYSVALDGASISGEDSLSGSIDIEDYTLMLLCHHEYHRKQIEHYDHILIDEIQELSATELKTHWYLPSRCLDHSCR